MNRLAKTIIILFLSLALTMSLLACAEVSDAAETAVEATPAGNDQAEAAAPEALPEPPTAEELATGYLDVLAGLESGTAGASLKAAIAASEVCAFAAAHGLYDPDAKPLQDDLIAALEAMDEDARARFWEGFDAVSALLDDCLEDYEANRAVFEDAGVAEAMDEAMHDPLNQLAWVSLRDQTLEIERF